MNIYVASSLFGVMILVYWVIAELITMLFRFTGLPDERARFQVVSLLTGCGFTTRESEIILSSRSRRRLARITMLFGYVFNITIVSVFVNVFISLKWVEVGQTFTAMLIPFASVIAVLVFVRIRPVRARFDRAISRLAGRLLGQDTENTVLLMDYIGSDSVALVTLTKVPEPLAGIPLKDTGLKTEQNILVMLVERGGGKAEAAGADTVFLPGDKLTVFGPYGAICKAFSAKEHFAEE